jgi:hypothetical protein
MLFVKHVTLRFPSHLTAGFVVLDVSCRVTIQVADIETGAKKRRKMAPTWPHSKTVESGSGVSY